MSTIFVIWMAMAGCQTQQDEPQARDPEELKQLKLEISLNKEAVDPIELVTVTARFRNISDRLVKFQENPGLRCGATIYLEDPNGKQCRPLSFEPMGTYFPVTHELEPGAFKQGSAFCSLNFLRQEAHEKREFKVPLNGIWKVWASYELSRGKLSSNVVNIDVKEDNSIPANVRELFGSQAWHVLALGGETKDSDCARFREFVLSGVGASQRDVMAYVVGIQDLNASRYKNGVSMLQAALVSRGRNVDRRYVTLSLVNCHWYLKEFDEALSQLNKMELDTRDIETKNVTEMRAKILKESGKQ